MGLRRERRLQVKMREPWGSTLGPGTSLRKTRIKGSGTRKRGVPLLEKETYQKGGRRRLAKGSEWVICGAKLGLAGRAGGENDNRRLHMEETGRGENSSKSKSLRPARRQRVVIKKGEATKKYGIGEHMSRNLDVG